MKNAINRQKLYLEMNQSLQRKYDTAFHFFRAKWINQLLDGPRHHPSYQKFLDLRMDVEQVQFLKRFYYIKTQTGKLEIESRIKLCTDFYADKMDLAYQYPTIFITNTKSLFLRRNKRLKKIQAGEGSSDETEHNPDRYEHREEHSSNFLEGLSESRIQQEDNESDIQLSFQSNPYDIYESSVIIKESSLPKIKLKQINEREVSHLINEGNVSQLRQYSRNTVINMQSQQKSEKQSRISVVPIQQRLIISKQKKSGILSNYFDNFLDQKISFGGLGFVEHPLVTQHKNSDFNILKINSNSIQKERQQRTQRRQKIRQKAQQLLKKVRQDEQIEPIS